MASDASGVLNFNVGILGHVDSGKTTLAERISTVASTAAFDKNPQSKERGITLDLGFSSFCSSPPNHLTDQCSQVQYTLVDCPGHASLIKTIIGGAQIIDLMVLVVDITKGIQTQTAECLVIGEITCSKMIVVLNKIDAVEIGKRDKTIEKMTKRLQATLANTRFKDKAPVVAVSAEAAADDADDNGIGKLVETLKEMTYLPERSSDGKMVFNVDHCFGIKGQGTIMTGTVLQGKISVGDTVEISALKESRKVKSMQMFKKPVTQARQGDRVGMCVTQFDASLLERGLVATPSYLPTIFGAVVSISRISWYKGDINSKAKFHISLGHETVLATITLFGCSSSSEEDDVGSPEDFSFESEFKMVAGISGDAEEEAEKRGADKAAFALLEFERPVVAVPGCKVLGSRLDTDIHKNVCRLAFDGQLLHSFTEKEYHKTDLVKLRIYKVKSKEGVVERLSNDYEVIAKNMFKKETNIHLFEGLKVKLSTGEWGKIDGPFGQSGKFKISLDSAISEEAKTSLAKKKQTKTPESSSSSSSSSPVRVTLNYILLFSPSVMSVSPVDFADFVVFVFDVDDAPLVSGRV